MYPNGAIIASIAGRSIFGASYEALGPWVTSMLSCLVAIGYCVIAIDWYFQSKLARVAEARAALRRLLGIFVACCLSGAAFYWVDIPWLAWRAYDAVLVIVAIRTWSFVLRTRGLSLVDERLALIDELEESAAKYRQIAELLPHMVWTATAEGRIDFSNQRWREYAADERTWLDTVHPDEAAHVQSAWREAIGSRAPMTLEARLGGAIGYRTFVVRATPIVQCDAVKWLGACADIEDQKRLSIEKETQAKQKTFFLNALSHDLRAPLHNVLLNAHLLKLELRDGVGAESVATIMENAVSAGDLLTRLLDFARVGATEAEAIQDVPVMDVLNQIVRRFLPVAEQKGLYLRVDDAGTTPDNTAASIIRADRQKLERIVSNFVDNAIKYTRRGGVSLSFDARSDGPTIVVRDTGIGVPAEHVPYLFDEFYQVGNYERDRSKGFGMGLAICRSLARAVGGEARLASTGPEGSTFELLIGSGRPAGGGDGRGLDRADRGGRPGREEGDRDDPEAAGLCRVGSGNRAGGDVRALA